MNPSDSKKLEEIDAKIDECGANRKDQHWLISKVKEQDREIERLRGNFRGTYSFKEADYQRRRRKWALKEIYMWRKSFEDACCEMDELSSRAENAEARVKELEDGISEIIDCVAKVSVDIHHSEPGEEWKSPPFLAEKEKGA